MGGSGSDWAGGPGENKEDVKWLNDKLVDFFKRTPISDSLTAALKDLKV